MPPSLVLTHRSSEGGFDSLHSHDKISAPLVGTRIITKRRCNSIYMRCCSAWNGMRNAMGMCTWRRILTGAVQRGTHCCAADPAAARRGQQTLLPPHFPRLHPTPIPLEVRRCRARPAQSGAGLPGRRASTRREAPAASQPPAAPCSDRRPTCVHRSCDLVIGTWPSWTAGLSEGVGRAFTGEVRHCAEGRMIASAAAAGICTQGAWACKQHSDDKPSTLRLLSCTRRSKSKDTTSVPGRWPMRSGASQCMFHCSILY